MRVNVHNWKRWNGARDEFDHPVLKSTEERIKRLQGAIIPGTAEEVDAADLDHDGRYDPKKRQMRKR